MSGCNKTYMAPPVFAIFTYYDNVALARFIFFIIRTARAYEGISLSFIEFVVDKGYPCTLAVDSAVCKAVDSDRSSESSG